MAEEKAPLKGKGRSTDKGNEKGDTGQKVRNSSRELERGEHSSAAQGYKPEEIKEKFVGKISRKKEKICSHVA